ncbi:MAG: uncharacterized protein KVP18_001944 [Porospora cf. gigantea A]|uniref:uncharacterized protein n=1 Tax=Porospora cf. gigantea A TaxID=2853593 RepID=UPI003559CA5F|nr:MAG: hypothetical protein KVP18_001944 [Porospora cf. gigantea A]
MDLALFNVKDGFPEALVRGFRQSLLTPEDYRRMGMAETLEDLRTALEDSDYGNFLQDEPSPLTVATITARCREKHAEEFLFLRSQCGQPAVKFLDFIVQEKMVDNLVSLVQGAINKKPVDELISKTDPLGWFAEMKAVAALDVSAGYDELYRTVLIDSPVAPYFERYLNQFQVDGQGQRTLHDVDHILNELDLEVLRNSLKKSWLEDFFTFCCTLDSVTAEVMSHILKTEADYRVLTVTLNTLNQEGNQDVSDRMALYPNFGYLYPEGTDKIRKAFNETTLRAALDGYAPYIELFDQCKGLYLNDDEGGPDPDAASLNTLEDLIYKRNVQSFEMAFEQQMHFGVYYAWAKLREQEIRNITWIADMIVMSRREHIDNIIPLFAPRI